MNSAEITEFNMYQATYDEWTKTMSTDHGVETPQHTPGPWMVATSNSWRRIVTKARGDAVIEPTTHRVDGHPDLAGKMEDLELAAMAPELLDTIRELRLAFDALKSCSDSQTKNATDALKLAEDAELELATIRTELRALLTDGEGPLYHTVMVPRAVLEKLANG